VLFCGQLGKHLIHEQNNDDGNDDDDDDDDDVYYENRIHKVR